MSKCILVKIFFWSKPQSIRVSFRAPRLISARDRARRWLLKFFAVDLSVVTWIAPKNVEYGSAHITFEEQEHIHSTHPFEQIKFKQNANRRRVTSNNPRIHIPQHKIHFTE